MKAQTKRKLLQLLVCGQLLYWVGYYFFDSESPRNRVQTLETIRHWGRVAEFPKSTRRLYTWDDSVMFNPAFRAYFEAPAAEIETWIQDSPGLRSTPPSSRPPGFRHFQIEPGDGAQIAMVTINDIEHSVRIYVCWH